MNTNFHSPIAFIETTKTGVLLKINQVAIDLFELPEKLLQNTADYQYLIDYQTYQTNSRKLEQYFQQIFKRAEHGLCRKWQIEGD